jgi:hypothetical protein
MFRNSLDGNRDMYVAASEDHGETLRIPDRADHDSGLMAIGIPG